VVDAMAEKYLSTSPYAYVENNPITFTDYLGLVKTIDDPDHPWWEEYYGFVHSMNGAGRHYNSVGRSRGFHDNFHGTHTIDDDYTYIEGMYIWNGDIITITNLKGIEFVINGLKGDDMVLTMVELRNGDIVPILSKGPLGQIFLDQYGDIFAVENSTAAFCPGGALVNEKGYSSFRKWNSNTTKALGMTANWALGTADENTVYENNNVSESFRNSRGVNNARTAFYLFNRGRYNLKGLKPALAKFGLPGLRSAGLDPIEQFVGSYQVSIDVEGDNLKYTIFNKSSLRSLLYHITPESWNPINGPGGTTKQYYIFYEQIIYSKL
jgi:hypothetical protein